jgi:DNA-binding beta-propeller fold protein YncE
MRVPAWLLSVGGVMLASASCLGSDHPLDADLLKLRERATGAEAKIAWRSRTPLSTPLDDPRVGGAMLRIDGLDAPALFFLPPNQWTVDATGTRYQFKDSRRWPGRPAPVKKVLLKQGAGAQLTGKSERIDLDASAPTSVSLSLTIGSDVYCVVCSSPVVSVPGRFDAKSCAAPVSCPSPPPPACGTYLTKWGSFGTRPGQFGSYVYGIGTDADGNVYVADRGNQRIEKFDAGGAFLTMWGSHGTGDGQFMRPVAVTADAAGNVYAVDLAPARIQKFTSDGTFLLAWGSDGSGPGEFDFPYGVDVDAGGNVYVADSGNDRIQKFDASGTFLSQWGTSGTGDGQFDEPYDVAVDGAGNVFVVDADNHRIQKFDSAGVFLLAWGSEGTGNGQFTYPLRVAVDGSGSVYVTDPDANRVQKFDGNGTYLGDLSTGGQGDGLLFFPIGVATGQGGKVYVTDRFETERMQLFLCP